jgi:hypothetical protein
MIASILARLLREESSIAQYVGQQNKFKNLECFVLGKGSDKKYVIQFFNGTQLRGVDKQDLKIHKPNYD